MSEQKIPIPAMLYNAAVGGHVTNSQQIIDENLNREQNDINQETVGAVPYNSTTPNGMGRIVLKKNDNFKEVVEAQTNGNTIFVIKYDFTLTGNVTIPANCVLQFDGGSISGAYTLTGTETIIQANPVQIFGNNMTIGYNSFIPYNNVIYPEWFGANDLGSALSTACMIKANKSVIKLQPKEYHLTTPAKLIAGVVVDLNNATVNVDDDIPAFVDFNYQKSTHLACSNIVIKNGTIKLTTERTEETSYVIDIANASYLTLEKLYFNISNGVTLNSAFGVRLGRKTTEYTGATYVNTIKDCTLYHIKIESGTTDSYMINNKVWASNIDDGAINISASSWQIISNQIVGGKKGAIYIPPYGKPSILKIIGNYFDGSYYNLDTQNGINIDYDAAVDTYLLNSVISDNTFWHQKGYGIYGKMINCVITNNVFDDCDFYNEGLPDILLKGGGQCNQICSNTFVRKQYVDLNNVHHARINQDTETFTRPPIIKTEGESWRHQIIQNNVCGSEEYYNKADYAENSSSYSYVLVNHCSPIFCNNGWHGNSNTRPSNVQVGFQYFDTTLGKPVYWNGTDWVDATGATV